MATLRFLADVMLGRLATWLRILGYDCEYDRRWSDREILKQQRETGRFVLTRDRDLLGRLPLDSRYGVECDRVLDQLRDLCRDLDLTVSDDRLFTRCLRCNVELNQASRSEVERNVPPYVFSTQTEFSRCGHCGRIFWAATHRASAVERLKSAGLL